MFSPGWTEMLIIGFIALLLFGKRLPEVARSFGQSFMEFKKGMTSFETDMRSSVYSDPKPTPPPKTNRIETDLKPNAEKFELQDEPQDDAVSNG